MNAQDGPFTRYKISRYACEFVGTFVLVASIKLLIGSGTPYAPFGIGLTLLVIVSIYGYISLAQFNPSVTIGFVVRNSKSLPRSDYMQWILYIICQICGGICGGFFAWLAGGKDACNVYTYVNTDEYTVSQAFFSELFYCMMIVTVNLHVASDDRLNGNQVYAAAIGMILTVSALSIGPITGSAINTAVWIGTVASAAACVEDGETLNLDACWIYWVAHILGGLIAGAWFVLIYGREMDGVVDVAIISNDANINVNNQNDVGSSSKGNNNRTDTEIAEYKKVSTSVTQQTNTIEEEDQIR
eukprot:318732_1